MKLSHLVHFPFALYSGLVSAHILLPRGSDAFSPHDARRSSDYARACAQIARAIAPTSRLSYPGSELYQNLTDRFTLAASLPSACAVEPASSSDVGKILRIVGLTRTPFAVQSGGHSPNPGFSSTRGIHISLTAFRSIIYNETTQHVTFGTGLRWRDVYQALAPFGRSALGGRIPDVGVGGFILGGGYSFMTNQYGLGLDHVVSLEVVKPTGEVAIVSQDSDPELFFAFKGTHNNFGIVTKITMKTFPQGPVWSAALVFTDPVIFPRVFHEVSTWSTDASDPKATLICIVSIPPNSPGVIYVNMMYDAPEAPPGTFEKVLAIPSNQSFVFNNQDWLTFVMGNGAARDPRNLGGVVSAPGYSARLLERVYNMTLGYSQRLSSRSLNGLVFVPEPFLPTILNHGSASAWPFTREQRYTPFPIGASWSDPADDAFFHRATQEMTEKLEKIVNEEFGRGAGVKRAPLYPNYAHPDTPLNRLFGTNLERLRKLKRRVDPRGVMGLAGGFKL